MLGVLLAALLLLTGGGKLTRSESSRKIRDGLAVPPLLWLLVGVVELATATALILGAWLEPGWPGKVSSSRDRVEVRE